MTPVWAWDLELEISVVGDSHELRVAWASQHAVVGSMESDHLKGESFPPVVGWGSKSDGQVNLPEGFGMFP
jgi:hypothetical protein